MNLTSKKPNLPALAWARAPGKVILAGEQFVVLGAPAVSMAINFYSNVEVKPQSSRGLNIGIDIPLKFLALPSQTNRVEDPESFLLPLKIAAETALKNGQSTSPGLNVNVECEIPIAAGLGSSASTTVSIISGISRLQGVKLDRRELFKLAFVPEKFLHGRPSGVDQATCIYGGTIQFTRPSGIKPVPIKTDPMLLLCDTGVHHQTRKLVGSVVKKSRLQKAKFRDYLSRVRQISDGVVRALKTGDREDLGTLMSENHELLQKIGVSHPKLDRLVDVANRAGALGAKLTGAGGGGCIVAVCSTASQRERIARSLRREGGTPYKISRDIRGVETGIRW